MSMQLLACRYNCSYMPINRKESFSEALYILMTGCGVGYSVERKWVDQLPTVPHHMQPVSSSIVVDDSKEGWVMALRRYMDNLWGIGTKSGRPQICGRFRWQWVATHLLSVCSFRIAPGWLCTRGVAHQIRIRSRISAC
jgi:hypothetical protein